MNNIKKYDGSKGKCIAVIPSINGSHLLKNLIPTLDIPLDHVLVVDQASHDDTTTYCESHQINLLQLGQQATFTYAVNCGVKWALEQGAEFVLILNNDIQFKTNITSQLIDCITTEENVGVIAPRQVITQVVPLLNEAEKSGESKDEFVVEELAHISRASWNLTALDFTHDLGLPITNPILEADFCEFTCVLIPKNIFSEVGLLNEKYEFYHEDADFAYRIREKNYRAIYLQTAEIFHESSSTFNKQKVFDKSVLIKRNKQMFLNDHLSYRINFPFLSINGVSSWDVTNKNMYLYAEKYGLLSNKTRTLSTLAHPDMVDTDYLFTVWETTKIPSTWMPALKKFKHIFVPSVWNKEVLNEAGFNNVSIFPLGIDADVFNPYGHKHKFPWQKTVLVVCRNQYRKAIDVSLAAWRDLKGMHQGTFMAFYGQDIDKLPLNGEKTVQNLSELILEVYPDEQVVLIKPRYSNVLTSEQMASLYRSSDLYLLNSRSEGFGFPVIEAMACGALSVLPNYGSVSEFVTPDLCFSFNGDLVKADYSDKGFDDVGQWWEPRLNELISSINSALNCDNEKAKELTFNARQMVLHRYTWRTSVMTLRSELLKIQPKEESLHDIKTSFSKVPPYISSPFKRKVYGRIAHYIQKSAHAQSVVANSFAHHGVRYTVYKSCVTLAKKIIRK